MLILDAILFGVGPLIGVIWLILIANFDIPTPDVVQTAYYSWYAAAEPVLAFAGVCALPLWIGSYGGALIASIWALRGNGTARTLLLIAIVWFNIVHLAGLRLRDRFEAVDVASTAQTVAAFQGRVIFAFFVAALNAIVLMGPIARTYFVEAPAIEGGHRDAS